MSEQQDEQLDSARDNYDWLRIPELAAFRTGRYVNQIEHETTVLWLHGREEEANTSLNLSAYRSSGIPWRTLALTARGAISDERQRVTIELMIEEVERHWNKQFLSLWHSEFLIEQNEQIEVDRIERLHHEPELTLREIVERKCQIILWSVNEINNSIQNKFLTILDSRQLEFFRLGQHFDRLVNPIPAFDEMLPLKENSPLRDETMCDAGAAIESIDELASTGPSEEQQTSWLTSDHDQNPNIDYVPAPWRLPRTPLVTSLSSSGWWEELRCRAIPCGVEESLRARQSGEGDGIDQRRFHEDATRLAEEIETAIYTNFSPASATNHTPDQLESVMPVSLGEGQSNPQNSDTESGWNSTSVDLEFNKGRLEVRRKGTDQFANQLTRMDFNVLEFIAQNGGRFRSREELESKWEDLGGASDGANSIDSRLTAVRTILRKLGKKLENKTGIGWRVVDAKVL